MILSIQFLPNLIDLASLCLVTVVSLSIHPSEVAKHAVVRAWGPPQSSRLQPQIQIAAPAIGVVQHTIDAVYLTTGQPDRACPDGNKRRQTCIWWQPTIVLPRPHVIKKCLIIQIVKRTTSISFKFLPVALNSTTRPKQIFKQNKRAKISTNTNLTNWTAKAIVLQNLIMKWVPIEIELK